jgi:hypothetical protein
LSDRPFLRCSSSPARLEFSTCRRIPKAAYLARFDQMVRVWKHCKPERLPRENFTRGRESQALRNARESPPAEENPVSNDF